MTGKQQLSEVDPVTEVYKRDVDRTLLRENLKLTPEQRLLKLIDFVKFAAELRSAGAATWPRK